MAKAAKPAKADKPDNVHEIPDGPPDESGLTPRQHRVLEVIRDSVERRGYPPSMREIGEAVGLTSTSSVAHQLATLDDEATVKTFSRKDGHVWLLPQNADYSPIDGDHATILGRVTAVLRRL